MKATPVLETLPFARVLVPYDGSAPSEAALAFGIALARHGSALDVLNIVDETSVIAQSATTAIAWDPMPLIDALDAQGNALLDAARTHALRGGVEPHTTLLHELPISGILNTAKENGDGLIVMGTHARGGLPRTFLGSTTEGVLRAGTIPVLAVRADTPPPPEHLFATILVAVDDSDPSDAAVAVAASLARLPGSSAVVCSTFDTSEVLSKAAVYGYDPETFVDTQRANAQNVVDRALAHGGFPAGTARASVLEGEPAKEIVAEAERIGAGVIVMGSHGRRGLQRLFLGSVAEHVVRHSPVPVLVVRSREG